MFVRSKNYEIDMLNSPIFKSLLLLTIPLIISNIFQLLFNAADVIVVGKIAGDIYLAAVSSTTHLINLLTNIFTGFAVGVNVYVARLIGESKKDKISAALHSSILFGILIGIVSTLIGLFAARPLLEITGCPDEIIDLAITYLRIYFLGMPAMLVYNYAAGILRAKGDTKRPLYFLVIAGIVNVVLNIIFVAIFKLHVIGVALATIISQSLSAILTLLILAKENDEFKLFISKMKLEKESLKEIIRIGLPAGIQNSMFAISNVVIQAYINSFGTAVIAGSGAAHSAESFANGTITALLMATMTYVSQNYGAKNYKRINKTVLYSYLLSMIFCLFFVLVTYFFGEVFLSLYSNSPEVIEQALIRFRLTMYTYIFFALMQMMAGALRGIGYSIVPAFTCLFFVCGIRLFLIIFVFNKYINFFYVMLTYPISWAVTWIILLVAFIIIMRRMAIQNN